MEPSSAYKVVIEPLADEDGGGYLASIPDPKRAAA